MCSSHTQSVAYAEKGHFVVQDLLTGHAV